uniref:ATP synthase F0 subunit 8 n=1 Tax=Armillifer agkistrodontis TaxID=592791 RepID=A0A1J0CYI1_ARMAG|nr:ATP synthase F0 subunit 8 [Armillifer agkistrodontis]APB92068.1 ATP synthase F0 subunit 8 [Armillifer agkistrodontis]
MPHMMPLHWTSIMMMINMLLIIMITLSHCHTMKLKK